jgi:copper chaperone
METLQFKTTIKCMGCVANATPNLNKVAGNDNWKVDIQHPDKILEVQTNGTVQAADIIKAVQEAGYKAAPVE